VRGVAGGGVGGGLPVRVLDLADASGALAGRLLVGLGAEVIRVEPPGGDPLRASDPLAFAHWHAGKRSVTLDLAAPAGAERLRRLAATADVLVETGPPGGLEPLGLGWPALSDVNPALVLVSITPFGQDGPRAAWRATSLILSALGGMTWLSGAPGGPPLDPPREQAFQLAGAVGAIGALLGLRARRRTGRGQHVDVAAQEVVAATLEYGTLRYLHEGVVHRRTGNRYPHVPHGLFPARDGHVAGGFGGSPRMWDGLLAWLQETGAAEDLGDPRFADEPTRLRERGHIFAVIERFTGGLEKTAFHREAQRRRLPWAAVARADEVLTSPQLRARGFFVEVDVDGRWRPDVGFAFGFPEGRRPSRLRVPALGDANADLLDEPSAALDRRAGVRTRDRQGSGSGAAASAGGREASPPRAGAGGGWGALAGTRVLDLTWVLAGPYATKILADHGAEVIKVESRHRPDPSRLSAALHLSRDASRHPDSSGYFNNFNRNKSSVVVNLARPEGLGLLRRLVAASDVVIENFSARVLASWGLDYPTLAACRPDLVLVSMAGMGHTGPWRDHVTYADAVQALSGLAAEVGLPGEAPLGLTFGLGDMIAGYHAALATLAALEWRDATGRGQHVDLSQVEAVASHLGTAVLEVSASGAPRGPDGSRHRTMAPHGVFPCQGEDRWIAIAVGTDPEWRALCGALGRPEAAGDPRFATAASRKANESACEALVAGWTGGQDRDALVARLQAAGVPAGAVQDGRDLVEVDPQLRARGFYVPLRHPRAGVFLHEGVVPRLGGTPGAIAAPAPCLGEHTSAVLRGVLGLDDAEIERHRALGVLE
jgi:crotonobetainyl-CoA:carnitine CoA-transferase CaiB-like acyl-CoA transferase